MAIIIGLLFGIGSQVRARRLIQVATDIGACALVRIPVLAVESKNLLGPERALPIL
jgi:hypothetical protein